MFEHLFSIVSQKILQCESMQQEVPFFEYCENFVDNSTWGTNVWFMTTCAWPGPGMECMEAVSCT